MASVRLAEVADVPPGAVCEAEYGGQSFAVCNVDGEFFVVSGDCPHRDGPLGHGALHGTTVVCPWHAWEFDVRTGECFAHPDCRIATYTVSVHEGAIFIERS
jgi:nitrite reductase/ring-hydroxylating ferredoxin subunit